MSRPLTSILRVVSIIFQREYKQWLWKIPEIALKVNVRADAFAIIALADLEKSRNRVYIVRRAEQECLFTFEPAPQLNEKFASDSRLVIEVDSTCL